jgi:hypothetical protein
MMMMGAERQVRSLGRKGAKNYFTTRARTPSVLKGFINNAHMGFCDQAAEAKTGKTICICDELKIMQAHSAGCHDIVVDARFAFGIIIMHLDGGAPFPH